MHLLGRQEGHSAGGPFKSKTSLLYPDTACTVVVDQGKLKWLSSQRDTALGDKGRKVTWIKSNRVQICLCFEGEIQKVINAGFITCIQRFMGELLSLTTNTEIKQGISLSRSLSACVLWNHLFANRMSPVRAHQCLCLSWKWHISHIWHMLSVLYPSNLCSEPPPSPGLTKIQFTGCQLNSIILSTAVVER